jgi:hypothetical protein
MSLFLKFINQGKPKENSNYLMARQAGLIWQKLPKQFILN